MREKNALSSLLEITFSLGLGVTQPPLWMSFSHSAQHLEKEVESRPIPPPLLFPLHFPVLSCT